MLFHNSKYLPAQLIGCLKISKIFKRNYTFLILKFKFNFTFVRCLSKVGKKMKIKTFFCKPAINLARQANYWKSYFFFFILSFLLQLFREFRQVMSLSVFDRSVINYTRSLNRFKFFKKRNGFVELFLFIQKQFFNLFSAFWNFAT